MNTQMHYIQTGWTVRTSDGHDLGRVIDLSPDAIIVRDDDGQQQTIPKTAIDEEDEGAMLAILSIDSERLQGDGF